MRSEPDIPALFVHSVSRLGEKHPLERMIFSRSFRRGVGWSVWGIFFFPPPSSFPLGNLNDLCSAYLPSSSAPHEISLRRHLEPAFHRRHIASVV